MKKTIIIAVVIIGVGLIVWLVKGSTQQQVSQLDAVDTVGEFYGQWLEALKEPSTAEPDLGTLAKSPILSKSLRNKLVSAVEDGDMTPDLVLCQTVVPEDISIRNLTNLPDKFQALIMSRDKKVTEQAVVTLLKLNEGWYIDDIECSPGEFEPEREFGFEKDGYLLKGSVPSPYDPKNWHLVFEENGELGHVVPLFFDSESQCVGSDGTESLCNPDQLTEATRVFVQGQMSELGVMVKRQKFMK